MRNKRIIIIISISLVMILMAVAWVSRINGYDNKAEFDIAKFEEDQSKNLSDVYGEIASDGWMIKVDGNGWSRLQNVNLVTGERTKFCFDPSCEHEAGSGCIADYSTSGPIIFLYVYNENLYVFTENGLVINIYKVDVKNNKKEKLTGITTKGQIHFYSFYKCEGSKLYYTLDYRDPDYSYFKYENGLVGSVKYITDIGTIDLDTGDYTILDEMPSKYDAWAQINYCDGNIIQIDYDYSAMAREERYNMLTGEVLVENPEQYDIQSTLNYNLETGTITEATEVMYYLNREGDLKHFVDVTNKQIKTYKESELIGTYDIKYWPENKWILQYVQGYLFMQQRIDNKDIVNILDQSGTVMQTVDAEDLTILGTCPSSVLIGTGTLLHIGAIIPMDDFLKAMENRDFSNIKSKAVRFKDVS